VWPEWRLSMFDFECLRKSDAREEVWMDEIELDVWAENQEALRAWTCGQISVHDLQDHLGEDIRHAYRRAKERRAAAELQADIMEGKLPDWPAWSEMMMGEPL